MQLVNQETILYTLIYTLQNVAHASLLHASFPCEWGSMLKSVWKVQRLPHSSWYTWMLHFTTSYFIPTEPSCNKKTYASHHREFRIKPSTTSRGADYAWKLHSFMSAFVLYPCACVLCLFCVHPCYCYMFRGTSDTLHLSICLPLDIWFICSFVCLYKKHPAIEVHLIMYLQVICPSWQWCGCMCYRWDACTACRMYLCYGGIRRFSALFDVE